MVMSCRPSEYPHAHRCTRVVLLTGEVAPIELIQERAVGIRRKAYAPPYMKQSLPDLDPPGPGVVEAGAVGLLGGA